MTKPVEHLTLAAANSTAVRIRDFWTARGYWPPTVQVVELPLGPNRGAIYGVRSDLRDGLPPLGRKIEVMAARFKTREGVRG